MFRNTMIALGSSAAIAIAAPALAQGQGGGHGAHGGGAQNAAPSAPMDNSARDAARANSQGPANASPTGTANANENSVLSTTETNTAARKEKTETQKVVRAGPNAGQVINKQRKPKDDAPADANEDRAAKSQGPANASPTGIANASDNSVLARGAVAATQLQGLNTGLTVNTAAGATLGTVTQVITGPNDTIRAIVVTSASGQTYTLAANTLTISGGVVTTTGTNIGG